MFLILMLYFNLYIKKPVAAQDRSHTVFPLLWHHLMNVHLAQWGGREKQVSLHQALLHDLLCSAEPLRQKRNTNYDRSL